jgi:SAM-dependent methyltransferase
MTRWDDVGGEVSGTPYAARFAALERKGVDVHGEAGFCATLLESGARVLDAGCGTGRVAIELERRGYRCVGVDVSEPMLEVARSTAPDQSWILSDLAALDLGQEFDLVVAAGNVIPLLAPGTEAEVIRRLSSHLKRGGVLVSGFGLDAAHLPLDDVPFGLSEYDEWCARSGLTLIARYATWDGDPFDAGHPAYAISVHTRV